MRRRLGHLTLLVVLGALVLAPAVRADHPGPGNTEARLTLEPDTYTLVLYGLALDFDRSSDLQIRLTLTSKDGSRVIFEERGTPCVDSQFCEHRTEVPAQPGEYRLRASVHRSAAGAAGPPLHEDVSGSLLVGARQAAAPDPVVAPVPDPNVGPAFGDEPDPSPDPDLLSDPLDGAGGPVVAPGATDVFDLGAALQCLAEGARTPAFDPRRPRLLTERRGVSCAEDPAGTFAVGRRTRVLATRSTLFSDSLGGPVMRLVQRARAWRLEGEDGRPLRSSLPLEAPGQTARLTVQGYACPESAGVLVAFETGTGRAIRGFVDPAAIPAALRRSLPRTGCRSRGGTSADATPFALRDPALPGRYFDGRSRRSTRSYGFYDLRAVGARRYLYVMANTTMVRGGGIVRAVVPVPGSFLRSDRFDYCDPNGAGPAGRASRSRVAWSYGQVLAAPDGTLTGIFGWVPTRALTGAAPPSGC